MTLDCNPLPELQRKPAVAMICKSSQPPVGISDVAEAVLRVFMEVLALAQQGGGEFRVVGAVGIELRFQSDAGVLLLEELTAVDLKRGEVRVQFHLHAAGTCAAGALAVQREAVVDAALNGLALRKVQ